MLSPSHSELAREFPLLGHQDLDRIVALGLALCVAVAVELAHHRGDGEAHVLAAFGLHSAGLEGGEHGRERGGEDGSSGCGEEAEDGLELHF